MTGNLALENREANSMLLRTCSQNLKHEKALIWGWLFILGLSLILVIPWIVNRPFASKGEPREALTAKAMIETGNWVLPERLENELPTKPPLTHWLIALTAKATGGMSEGASRTPSALLATAVSLLLFAWAMRSSISGQLSLKHGIVSATVLLLSVEWHRASMTSRVDMTLSAFLFFGLIAAYSWSERRLKGYPWLALASFAMATLAKGPVGLLLPGIVLFAYFLTEGHKIRSIVPALLKVFIPALGLCAVWYCLAYAQAGDKFLQIVLKENLGRFLGKMDDMGEPPHAHNALYLYLTVLLGMLPWTIPLLQSVFSATFESFRSRKVKYDPEPLSKLPDRFPLGQKILGQKILGQTKKLAQDWHTLPKSVRFSAIVSLTFILFFSIVESKRSVYLLPIYPFLSLLAANTLIAIYEKKPQIIRNCSALIAGLVIFAYAASAVTAFLPQLQQKLAHLSKTPGEGQVYLELAKTSLQSFAPWQIGLLCLSPILATFTLISVFWKKTLASLILGVSVYATCVLGLDAVLFPAISSKLSAQSFVRTLEAVEGDPTWKSASWYFFGDRLYGLSYYLNSPLKRLEIGNLPTTKFRVLLLERDKSKLESELGNAFVYTELATSKWGVEKPLDKVSLVEVSRIVSVN